MESLKRIWIALVMVALTASALPVQALSCGCGCRHSLRSPAPKPAAPKPVSRATKARCHHCHGMRAATASVAAPTATTTELATALPGASVPTKPCRCHKPGALPESCSTGPPAQASGLVPAPPVHPQSEFFSAFGLVELERYLPLVSLACTERCREFRVPIGWTLPRSPHLLCTHLDLPPPALA